MANGQDPTPNTIDQLVEAVLKSPKYRKISPDLIRNIGIRELSKKRKLKSAVKSTKDKLHQIAGSYFLKKPTYELWLKKLVNAEESQNETLFRTICTEIMECHYSTRQRLPILDQFYREIFSALPHIESIADIACGLHPLAIPWMPLQSDTKYYSFDVYNDLTAFLNEFTSIARVRGYAETRDVTMDTPRIRTDLAFLLNTLPCLEQVEKSCSQRVLESINADFIAVSFPTKSLGGRERNMKRFYAESFGKLVKEKNWAVRQVEIGQELVFLINKNR